MGRHRHITCVRSDGLSAILRPLLDDRRIVAATLVDVGSGLILDGYADDPALADLELLGAGHADLVRAAVAVAEGAPTELTVGTGDGRHHLLHAVPDPYGDRLVLAVVVRGGAWHVARARRQLRSVSVAALTAGPTLQKRPVDGSWFPETPDTTPIPHVGPATAPGATSGADETDAAVPAAREPIDHGWGSPAPVLGPAPPSAMVPRA